MRRIIALALFCCLLLTACGSGNETPTHVPDIIESPGQTPQQSARPMPPSQGQETAAPSPTASAAASPTPTPKGSEPPAAGSGKWTKTQIKQLQQYFADPRSWYCQTLTSDFSAPEQIDLTQLFYNGIPGVDNTLSPEERRYLEGVWDEFAFHLDIIRLPAEQMDAVLREILGLSLQQTEKNGLEEMAYWPEGDCYYLFHGDTNACQVLVYSAGTRPDGTVRMVYSYGNFDAGLSALPERVAVLRPRTGGGYTIQSNQALS